VVQGLTQAQTEYVDPEAKGRVGLMCSISGSGEMERQPGDGKRYRRGCPRAARHRLRDGRQNVVTPPTQGQPKAMEQTRTSAQSARGIQKGVDQMRETDLA